MIRIVETENGTVRGIEAADPRITAFKGIPFAAPPVGENRWREPQPCKNWEGVKECYRFAPISVQDTPGVGDGLYDREWHVDKDIEMSEDCLYLNVWTNAKTPDDKLPVVVWFFGGGLQWGYPAEMEFDGERVARRGVVVVSVNYRINVFGFLSHPEITAQQPDAPANFGNLDQQAGLKWVIRNIAAFGGDPENITIAGQSAGGGSVLSQIAAPSSKGLFKRAIIQSAFIRNPYDGSDIGTPEPIESAEKNGENFFEFMGVHSLEEARKLDAFYIRSKYAEYAQSHPRMFTVLDNKFCIGTPTDVYNSNKELQIPILAGNTEDEFPNFINAKDENEYRIKVKEIMGASAEEFFKFPEATKHDGNGNYARVSGIECTAKTVALTKEKQKDAAPFYYYRFAPEIPGWDHPGTFHSVELWFFFETLAKCWRPFNGKHYDLARQMCNYWCNFIKTGNPNGEDHDGTMMVEWKPYTEADKCSMIFTTDGPVTETQESSFIDFLVKMKVK